MILIFYKSFLFGVDLYYVISITIFYRISTAHAFTRENKIRSAKIACACRWKPPRYSGIVCFINGDIINTWYKVVTTFNRIDYSFISFISIYCALRVKEVIAIIHIWNIFHCHCQLHSLYHRMILFFGSRCWAFKLLHCFQQSSAHEAN